MNRISCPRCNGTTITEKNKNGEQTCKACGLVFTTHLCPVCGDYEFSGNGSFDICEVCGWEDDPVQMELLDETNCANRMSLNQARKAWKADCNARIALRLLSNDLISYIQKETGYGVKAIKAMSNRSFANLYNKIHSIECAETLPNGTVVSEKGKNAEKFCDAVRQIIWGYDIEDVESADGSHLCPVCKRYIFEETGSGDICEVCGWRDKSVQKTTDAEYRVYQMQLNQAKEAWENGYGGEWLMKLTMEEKEIIEVMSESDGKHIECIEKDDDHWTGWVDVYETDYDNADDEVKGHSICVMRDDNKNVIVYHNNIKWIRILSEQQMHFCPVCNEFVFHISNSLDICPVCGWKDDAKQEKCPDSTNGANQMSLNQAQEAWRITSPIE